MATQFDFIAPKFNGNRFNDHSIPLELLDDFVALEELIFEVAKWVFLNENNGRQRVPRNFSKNFSLKLNSINDGSAVANIILATLLSTSTEDNSVYFTKAKEQIIKAIHAAENDGNVGDFLPDNVLGYFNRIGKRLKEDESIDFSSESIAFNARLTQRSRKKLVLASSNITQYTCETSIRGYIPEIDKSKKTFTILLINGTRATAEYDTIHLPTINEAFKNYESKCKVLINGIGRFNKYDKLEGIDRIEYITILDQLDVPSRIDEIKNIKEGWYNGEGKVPTKNQLDWFSQIFESRYDDSLPLPYLFPTPGGDLLAEWSINQNEISLLINLNQHTAEFHSYNLKDGSTREVEVNLELEEDWKKILDFLKSKTNE